MEMNEMNLTQVEARLAELDIEVRDMTDVEAVKAATEEKRVLLERKAELASIEQRKSDAEALRTGAAVADKKIEIMKEERTMFDRKSPEYRSAFLAMVAGNASPEQRAIVADSVAGNYGDGIALPVAVEDAIWDQVCTAHPILNDVTVYRSGIVMKIPQITPTVISKKKDSASTSEMTYTTNEVVLAGADYHTYITLTYAERNMSSAALEARIINELGTVIGEAIAKDVFARILTDLSSTPAITYSAGTHDWLECLVTALGAANKASNPVVYAPANLYYSVLGAADSNGQPIFRNGLLLNAQFKLDNAATKVTVVDPKMFVLNMITDVSCKVGDDVKQAHYDIGGYARAEGCMRVVGAAAYIG